MLVKVMEVCYYAERAFRAERRETTEAQGGMHVTALELWLPTAGALTGEVVPLMTRDEASACVEEIKAHAETIRERLYAFAVGRGWEALGYTSLSASLEAEFGMSKGRATQLMQAYEIDRMLGAPLEEAEFTKVNPDQPDAVAIETPIPERHARELVPLKDDPEAVREVYAEVVSEAKKGGKKATAHAVKEAVKRKRQAKTRPGLDPRVHIPGQWLQPQRAPREEPALLDRLYKTVQAFPDKAVTTALAEEIQAANLDLPDDVIRKLSDHLKESNSGRLTLIRGLGSLRTTRRNGTS